MTTTTRGERDNNPFNLEHGIEWHGLATMQSDLPYLQFLTPEWGITAGAKDIHNQPRLHGLNTVTKIITKFAPPGDNNDTVSYINHVAAAVGVATDDVLNLDDNETLFRFCKAIIMHENGRCIYDDTVIQGCVEDVLG